MGQTSTNYSQNVSKINNRLIRSEFTEKTLKLLKKGDRYRLFQFKFTVYNEFFNSNIKIVYKMLEEMPEIDIKKMHIKEATDEALNKLFEKSNLESKEEFYKVFKFSSNPLNKTTTH